MNKAVFPVMICPYTDDNKIDLNAVDALVEWYHDCGCDGIFTACLSTEIQHLTLEERVLVTDRVVKKANEIAKNGGRKMTIVASGHMADDFDEQVREITSIHATGVEAVILISNLKPATLCGVESAGMILAADCGEDDVKVVFLDGVPAGSKIR